MNDAPPVLLKVTQFALIDGAMVRLVKAVGAYEAAIYTAGERGAMENVLREAAGLRRAFEKVSKHVNDEHAARLKNGKVKQKAWSGSPRRGR